MGPDPRPCKRCGELMWFYHRWGGRPFEYCDECVKVVHRERSREYRRRQLAAKGLSRPSRPPENLPQGP